MAVATTDIQARIREMEHMDALQGVSDLGGDERIERTARPWSDPVRAGAAYFRVPDTRMARGRIALLLNGRNAMERVMYRDYVLLRAYHSYHGANHPADWQMTDPYLGIVQFGGISEFDAEQILDLCWHYRPGRESPQSHRMVWAKIDQLMTQEGLTEAEAVYAIMPQIAGHDLTVYTCEQCGPERKFRDGHALTHHRSVMHKADVQTVGTREAIVQALQAGGGGGANDALLTLLAQQGELIATMQAELAEMKGSRRGPGRPPKDSTPE